MLVIDTNIVAYLYLDPKYTQLLHALLQRDQDWIAPTLWRSELRNVLALYLRKGLLSMDAAIDVMKAAETLLGSKDYQSTSAHILALVVTSGCSAYDCEFVALARDLVQNQATFSVIVR